MVLRPTLDPRSVPAPSTGPAERAPSLGSPSPPPAQSAPKRVAVPVAPPVVTPVIVGLNVLVWVLMVVLGAPPMSPGGELLIQWGADYGPLTLNGEYWRLLSSAFLHAGFIHLGMNMYVLWGAGRAVERFYGRVAYGLLYLLAAIGGSTASVLMNPEVLSVGASGAVFGVVGAFAAFIFKNRKVIDPVARSALTRSLGTFLLINIAFGLAMPMIDNAAHVGGLISGALGGLIVSPTLTPRGPVHPKVRYAILPLLTVALVAVVAARGMLWPVPLPW